MKQIDIYRKMTGEQRFMQAIKLSQLIRTITQASIKNDFPKLSQREIIIKYLERISISQHGRTRYSAKTHPSL